MTLEELKKKKHELEEAVEQLINDWQDEAGIEVSGITEEFWRDRAADEAPEQKVARELGLTDDEETQIRPFKVRISIRL